MRIALVSDWAPPRLGGIERQLGDLAQQLRTRGHDVRIVTITPGAAALDGIPVHRLSSVVPPGWRGMQRALAPLGVSLCDPLPRRVSDELARILVTHRVDVVHAHSLWSLLTHQSMKLGREMGIGTVLTNHSLLERAGILFFRGVSGAGPWTQWPAVITAVSEPAARDVALATRRPVRVISNGVDTSAWARVRMPSVAAKRPGLQRTKRVVSVMRLVARKSPGLLLEAFATVRDRLNGEAPQLDVYGGGAMLSSLRSMADALGLDGAVTFHGARPSSEIVEALATADVFAHPGLHEAFGIAAVEALAAGIPVVAMRASAATHIFDDGVGGLFAENATTFAEHLARVVSDDALRARLAIGAPAQAERFDWGRVTPLYLAAYEAACTG